MSLLEGGGLRCDRHKFETNDVEKWNKHCSDGDHFEHGTTACTSCGVLMEFSGLPFHPLVRGSKNVSLKCDDCDTKTKGKVKLKKLAAATPKERSR